MRLPRTLFRYISREIILYGFLAFAAVSAVLVSHNLLRRLDALMMVGFTRADFWMVLKCLLPMLTAYTVPLAFLVGALLAIRRFVADGEFLAIRACGLGLLPMLLPTLTIALLIGLGTGYLMISVEHQARRDLLTLFKTVAARGGMFEPGRFANLSFGVMYVESRDREGTLRGVVISDSSNPKRPFRIFAETGTLSFDEEDDEIQLQLRNGELHMEPTGDGDFYRRVYFDEFHYVVDVSMHMRGALRPVRPKQMTQAELRAVLKRASEGDPLHELDEKNPIEYQMEIHRRIAMPVAPVLFGMLAVPLGVAGSRRGNTLGMIICVVTAFLYYAAFSLAQLVAQQALLSVPIAIWIPNTLLFVAGCVLIRRKSRDLPK